MPAPVVLIVAGSDSGGGAGIQADLKACEANGAFGTTAIAALTAQNTVGVQGVFPVTPEFVVQQMDSVLSDIGAHAVKTGMLATKEVISAVAARIRASGVESVVVDPVMIASSGDPLIAPDAVESFKTELFPLATVITPNLPEAGFLLGRTLDTAAQMEAAAKELLAMGPKAVLLKGGHLAGREAIEDFFATAEGVVRLPQTTVETRNTHGTGCTLASTIAAQLAKQAANPSLLSGGQPDLLGAVRAAQGYLHSVLEVSASHKIGTGKNGPLNHQRARDWAASGDGASGKPAGGAAAEMPLTAGFWDAAQKSIAASERHSFLTAMVDGSLAMEKFRFYVEQDALYLQDFAACLDLLAGHDGVSDADAALLRLSARGCAAAESGLHDSFLSKWGVERVAAAAPSTLMYTSYMLRVCATRPHAEGLAALLPCFWVYMHVGKQMLRRREELPEGSARPAEFDRWIDMYAGEGFEAAVLGYRRLVEEAAGAADKQTLAAMTSHFVRACELEWMFWTAAENLDVWPSFD